MSADHDESSLRPDTWLLCRTGTLLCALPLNHVIEIMRVLPVEAISGAPHFVRGLSIIRGFPVPVIDTGKLFGEQGTTSARLVTIRVGDRTVAFAVDEVLGVRAIESDVVVALPPLLRDAGGDALSAIGTLDGELLLFMNAARIVPDALFDDLSGAAA
jgi:purine-binding chemotaxis protein CheW